MSPLLLELGIKAEFVFYRLSHKHVKDDCQESLVGYRLILYLYVVRQVYDHYQLIPTLKTGASFNINIL